MIWKVLGHSTTHDRVQQPQVIISLENVHKTYLLGIEGIPALRGITLDVMQGEFIIVYGTSGGA